MSDICYAIILARSGSKSIKDKNIVLINNKPLVNYTIETCLASKKINRIFFLTDSQKYVDLVNKYPIEIPYIRSKKVSKDNSTDYSTIKDFLHRIKKLDYKLPNLLIHMRPTSPIREAEVVDKAIKEFIKKKQYTSLRSIHEMEESAYKTVEINKNKLVSSFSKIEDLDKINKARQNYNKTFYPNGYVDILRVNYIFKNNRLYGNKVMPFITADPIEIDSKRKISFLEFMLTKNK